MLTKKDAEELLKEAALDYQMGSISYSAYKLYKKLVEKLVVKK